MNYIKPQEVLEQMVQAGESKLPIKDALICGFLGGAILSFATTLAFTASTQTGLGIVGALLFPVGFVIIILLGLELATGTFALAPLAVLEKRASLGGMLKNFWRVIVGHILGAIVYAALFYVAATNFGHNENMVINTIIRIA